MMLERSTSTMPPTLFVCQRLYGLRAMLYCVIWSFRYSVSQPDGHAVLSKPVVSVSSVSQPDGHAVLSKLVVSVSLMRLMRLIPKTLNGASVLWVIHDYLEQNQRRGSQKRNLRLKIFMDEV